MAESKVTIGLLLPLQRNLEVDSSISAIPIFEGINVVGRDNLTVSDKRISRKHMSLCASVDGSAQVVVEGSNPIILMSGGQRNKFCSQGKFLITHDDILELIPGDHLFKYVTVGSEHATSSKSQLSSSSRGKRRTEDSYEAVKKNRQILEDEAFARQLQSLPDNDSSVDVNSLVVAKSCRSQLKSPADVVSYEDAEAIRHFSVLKDNISLTFRLLQVQGLPPWANSSSIAITDVIQGNVLVAILSNYMVDMEWLMSACPNLKKIPHVLVVHGEGDASVENMKKKKPANWIFHKPPLPIQYGTHHSKAMFLIYPNGVRVVVHTANLIFVDWNNKTQGLWMQDFPWKDQKSMNNGSLFENDLVDYLKTLKWPEFGVNLPVVGNVDINALFFKKFDYRSATVRLIASVPGYHMGPSLKKWGHMKMRSVLEEWMFEKEFCKSPLVYQFSSLGSLDEKWLTEFASSMSSGMTNDKSPLGMGKQLIIWPTVEDIRCSLEGYRAGSCVPGPQKNVEKEFLKKYWAKWKANHVGRCRAMPHIKTYARYNGQDLAWFLLTSANLSKAAWGALQKNNSQLMVRSYELGVLFLPSTIQYNQCPFSCTENNGSNQGNSRPPKFDGSTKTKLVTLCWKGNTSSEVIQLPVPYQLPPQPYTSEDVPWSWDRHYSKKDVYGQVWPSLM